jgi:GntR family transcriptional regulator
MTSPSGPPPAPPGEATASAGRAALAEGDARLPLHARLRDVLAARVEAGEWTPAVALPSEKALADHYGVALGTIRRVLGQLVDDGVLERRHGAGTYVRRAKLDASLFRFFRYGDPHLGPPESRILGFERAVPPPAAAEALGTAPGAPVLHVHRLRLSAERPVLVEDIWLPADRFAALAEVPRDELGDLLYPAYERHCGIVIASASEVLTVASAAAGEALLLRCERAEPLVVVERTARTHDGASVEWRRSRGRAADFRYRIEIR